MELIISIAYQNDAEGYGAPTTFTFEQKNKETDDQLLLRIFKRIARHEIFSYVQEEKRYGEAHLYVRLTSRRLEREKREELQKKLALLLVSNDVAIFKGCVW